MTERNEAAVELRKPEHRAEPLPPQGPRTEAGRGLYRRMANYGHRGTLMEGILAIEREAASPALDVRAMKRALQELGHYDAFAAFVDHGNTIADEYARLTAAVPRSPHAAWCNLPLDHKEMCEGDQ